MSPFWRGVLVAGVLPLLLVACTATQEPKVPEVWVQPAECFDLDEEFTLEYAQCMVACKRAGYGPGRDGTYLTDCPEVPCWIAGATATGYGERCTPPGSLFMELPSAHPYSKSTHEQNQKYKD